VGRVVYQVSSPKNKRGSNLNTLKCIATLVLTASLGACVGCGGVKGLQNLTTQPSGQQQQGTSAISFAIPINTPGSQFANGPQPTPSQPGVHANATRPRPQFVDSTSNGNIQIFLDSNIALSFSTQLDGNGNPSQPAGTNSWQGGSATYTASTATTATGTVLSVAVNLTTVSGVQHTLGVVQTNGDCLRNVTGTTDWCLGGSGAISEGLVGLNKGYILAEGQKSFTLNPGSNDPLTLTLQGVLQSVYLCGSNGCDNTAGSPDSNGVYTMTAYPTDENGNAILGTLPYGNVSWDIEEVGTQHLLAITNRGPFVAPQLRQNHAGGSWWDYETFSFTCTATGDTAIVARLVNNKAAGLVTGFTYDNANYPQPGAVLGYIGADVFYGTPGIPVHCEVPGNISITLN
jgi:hypothetical protein